MFKSHLDSLTWVMPDSLFGVASAPKPWLTFLSHLDSLCYESVPLNKVACDHSCFFQKQKHDMPRKKIAIVNKNMQLTSSDFQQSLSYEVMGTQGKPGSYDVSGH